MKSFKQLPNDRYTAENQLKGFNELKKWISKIYKDNKEYNPRQLHYLIEMVSLDDHLDTLISWDENIKGDKTMFGKSKIGNKVKPIVPPKKPLPQLKIEDKVIVWDSEEDKYQRHFSHFDENGKINCFTCGCTSWTNTETAFWDNWVLANEEEIRKGFINDV